MSVVLCGGALAESTGVYHLPSARLSLMLLAEPPEEALVILREPEYRTRSVGEEAVVGKERGKRAPNMSTGCLRACSFGICRATCRISADARGPSSHLSFTPSAPP